MKHVRIDSLTRSTMASAITLLIAMLPAQQVAANNSGRYVVADENGVWHPAVAGAEGATFYPSWYFGLDLSQSKWDADDFENEATGAGIAVGNHFSPHLRWEFRYRFQQPESEYSGPEGEEHTLTSLAMDYLVSEPGDGFSPIVRGGVARSDSDGFEDEQSDAMALLGLGLQWREDRWTVRMMVEQSGEDQQWASVMLAGYIGGNESASASVYGNTTTTPDVMLEVEPEAME
ncbi:MAG: outer membrane beta-barrel protein, partial [Granulosicoccaceae bacterium]